MLNKNSKSFTIQNVDRLMDDEEPPLRTMNTTKETVMTTVMETLPNRATRRIETVGNKQSCFDRMLENSFFGLRNGMFIQNTTRYVNKLSLCSSVLFILIVVYVFVTEILKVGHVDYCCGVVH